MLDEERRAHERASAAGDLAAGVRLLHERVREGSVLPWQLELAAYCGDQAAWETLLPASRKALLDHEWGALRWDEEALWASIARLGREVELRVLRSAMSELEFSIETCVLEPEMIEARGILERALGGGMSASEALCQDQVPNSKAISNAIDELRSSAEGRRPELSPLAWVSGLRWGRVTVLRAIAATWRHSQGTKAREHGSLEVWLAKPSPKTGEIVSRFEEFQSVLGPAGLPMEDRPPSALRMFALRREPMQRETMQEIILPELRAYALGGPVLRFEGLDVLEELGERRKGADFFLVRDPATRKILHLVQLRNSSDYPVDRIRALDHPNLAKLERVGHHHLVFDRMGGAPLADWLNQQPQLERRLAVVRGILGGLEHAHKRGVTHGCLAPESVFVEGDTARVVDHGHRLWGRIRTPFNDFSDGLAMSHSPEYAEEGIEATSERSDVYGAAALAAWILGGRPVLDPQPHYGFRSNILKGTPLVPADREVVLRKALARSPEDRFATLSAFREALLDRGD
jgi:serine/threonine-protein kinase